MSEVAIRVENLGKSYQIAHSTHSGYKTLQEDLVRLIRRPFDRSASNRETFWALKDISFEVNDGEVLGIIGRNGAGKSTLLKILSRITKPTCGSADVYGRVGSLLEVGTGFHPELTGRENVFLNGAILGMTRREIQRRFDEIVAFAEVEQFLDTPVKRYSSGMYMRLAFAVAAHLDPEVLVVDEVLAVGDAEFQKKCLGKMQDVAKGGRTVVFVSHDMGAIQTLTHKCILLNHGQIAHFADTPYVVQKYLESSLAVKQNGGSGVDLNAFRREKISDTPVNFSRAWVNGDSQLRPELKSGDSFTINVELDCRQSVEGANLTLTLKNALGHRIAMFFSWDADFSLFLKPGKQVVALQVNQLPLAPDTYFVDIGINQSTTTMAFDVVLDVPLFQIVEPADVLYWSDRPWGDLHWKQIAWSSVNATK